MEPSPGVDELEAPNVEVKVLIKNVSLVVPAASTPNEALYLSNLDDMIGTRVLTPSLYFYSKNEAKSPWKVIKSALSRVLVPYYPLAGRLRDVGGGKLEVMCTGEGALFVEARSSMALADLESFGIPNPSWKPLVYFFPQEEDYNVLNIPMVIAQVTSFSCGGFSLGLRICHCLCDGIGAMQFVNAWAEMARGSATLSVTPYWDREYLKPRSPPSIRFPHIEFAKIEDNSNLKTLMEEGQFMQKCFCFKRHHQLALKDRVYRESRLICTTFESLAGHVWRSWTRALRISPGEQEMRLSFSANGRYMFEPRLKEGFYGNVIGIACAMSSAKDLTSKKLSEAVRLVQMARKSITEEYIRSTIDYLELQRPSSLEFSAKLGITQWTRFSLYQTDFGWGRPIYAGPIDLSPTPQLCLFLPCVNDGDSIVVCMCLPPSSVSAFTRFLIEEE
eukprot:PITA_03799